MSKSLPKGTINLTQCCIALGANLGDPQVQFESALKAIGEAGHAVLLVSSNYVTPAMGEHAGDDFVNAAAVVDSNIPAEDFLQLLHHIETEIGRTRTITWGPRVLDLDLLLYGSEVIETSTLVVPHPSMWYRRFVLQPLSEIAAGWVHPVLQQSILELRKRLDSLPLEFALPDFDGLVISELQRHLTATFATDTFRLIHDSKAHASAFATIASLADDCVRIHKNQPRLESNRVIRLSSATPDFQDTSRLLQDVLTAALPPDACF